MIESLLRRRKLIFGIVLFLTLFLTWGLSRLQISFSFESFYPKDDPEYIFYNQYQGRFGEDQNYMVYISLKSPSNDAFEKDFVDRAHALFEEMGTFAGVDSFLTATSFSYVERKSLQFSQQPWLEWDSQESLDASRERILKDSSMLGIFTTHDLDYLCGYYFIDPAIFDSEARDELSYQLEDVLNASGLEYIISGIPFIRTKYVEKIGTELIMFLSLAFLLIVTVLYLTYRNWIGVLIPQLAVLTGLLWVLGFMGWTGQTINLINNLLIPIVFVVGMSDVIHLNTQYLAQLRLGKGKWEAMKSSLKEIGLSILLTSITTAIGFASLYVSRIPPIREFGLYAAAGVLFTFLVSVVILPNLMLGVAPEKFLKAPSLENQPIWIKFFNWVHRITKEKDKLVFSAFLIIIISSILLIFRISLDTYLIEDIGKNDPVRKSMEFFEEKAYGLRPFELGIEVKDSSMRVSDREVLLEMEKIQNFLHEEAKFSPFLSPVSLVSEANYVYHFNRDRYRRIPRKQTDIDQYLSMAQLNGGEALLNKVMTPDGRYARMSSRTADMGTYKFEELNQKLDAFIATETDTSLYSYKITGHAYLTEHNLNYIRSSLLWGLGLAFIAIGFIMGFLFRSWKMLFISMIPNVVPLILTGGLMGLFGITLTASTALVFVIAFGIAVDDTIHFLSRYRLERSLGHDLETAIMHTLQGTGKAMLLTSFVLCGGFILLLFSDFGGTFSTGLFTALTILFAMLADLFLLPILIRWVMRD